MDGNGVVFLYVMFILAVLPISTLAVLVVIGWHIGQKRWPSRRVKVGLAIWFGILFWDVPLKLVMLGWSCALWGGVWIADGFDPYFRPPAAWRSAAGCDQQCLAALDADPTSVVRVYVVEPKASAYAEQAGYFEYWRSTVGGHPSCIRPWRDVQAVLGPTDAQRPADDAERNDCLARSTPANSPDIPRFTTTKHTSPPIGILFFWQRHDQILTGFSSGKVVASISDYSIPLFWWVPGWVLSCPNTPLNVSIEDIRSGGYPKLS